MDSIALPIIPLIPFSQTLNLNPNRRFQTLRPRFSSIKTSSFSLRSSPLSFSCFPSLSGSGGGGAGLIGGSGGGGGGGGDGGSSGGERETRSIAVGEAAEVLDLGADDVIVLSVGGMSCGGCAASVKRILESQPQVSMATVSFEKETAVVWVVPEVKVTHNWQQQLGAKLANHLTSCGFKSDLRGQGEAVEGEIPS